jgi:hypothetical protein
MYYRSLIEGIAYISFKSYMKYFCTQYSFNEKVQRNLCTLVTFSSTSTYYYYVIIQGSYSTAYCKLFGQASGRDTCSSYLLRVCSDLQHRQQAQRPTTTNERLQITADIGNAPYCYIHIPGISMKIMH